MTINTCPDCAPTVNGHTHTHAETCPITRGLDETCQHDRDYFARHPLQRQRVRELTRQEIVWLRSHEAIIGPNASVSVTQLASGSVIRQLRGVVMPV